MAENQTPEGKASLETATAYMIESLEAYMTQQMQFPKMDIGVVVSSQAGPPATLTVTVHGQSVPSVRYIGTTPTNGSTVVLLKNGPRYVCLGKLT